MTESQGKIGPGLLAEVRALLSRGDESGARLRLLRAGIVTWVDRRGQPCVSVAKAARLLGVAWQTLVVAVRRERLPATLGTSEQACGGKMPWLIPLVHVVAYRVDPARQALGRLGGLATAAKVRALRARKTRRQKIS